MAANGFSVTSGANFAVGATAKTILNVISGTDSPPVICEFGISFDVISGAAAVVLLEMCSSTQGAAGTTGTIGTIVALRGYPSYTPRTTVAGQYSVEPTTLTAIKQWWIRPDQGPFVIQWPLNREPMGMITAATAMKGIAFRISAASGTPNARAYLEFEE